MPKTILIGLDGATFTVLDPLVERGVMPRLGDIARRGARAPLRSIVPALTPPAWTSLVTGKPPGQHGIFDFFRRDAPDSQLLRFASSQDVGAETIFTLASARGKRIVALNFPLMFPPPAVDGYVVPGGWLPWRQLRLGCHPPGLFDRLRKIPSFNPRELALDMETEEKSLEGCRPEEYADWIALHTRRERHWFDVLRFLWDEAEADLVAILFDGVDKLQHVCWRYLDPPTPVADAPVRDRQVRETVDGYFRQLDRLIAGICDLAGPDATVILASDHGFGPTDSVLYLNTWLAQNGYLSWAAESVAPPDEATPLGIAQIARQVYQLDWTRTRAYALTPSGNGIQIVRRAPGASHGVAPEDYLRFRAELAEKLEGIRHPETGERVVARAWPREDVFLGPFAPLAPDLTLVLADGGFVSILRSDAPIKRRVTVAGTHRPRGIFLATGPGVRRGVALPELSILDVAPTVLYSLGLGVPSDMIGKVVAAAFDPEFVAGRPVTQVPADPSPRPVRPPDGDAPTADEEETLLRRLRALGYVD